MASSNWIVVRPKGDLLVLEFPGQGPAHGKSLG